MLESGVGALGSNAVVLCRNLAGVDAFDDARSRRLLSTWGKAKQKPLVHAAVSADGAATCEGGDHLPLIALVATTLARAIQDYMKDGARNDAMVSLSGVVTL